jgi:hypothetical protein
LFRNRIITPSLLVLVFALTSPSKSQKIRYEDRFTVNPTHVGKADVPPSPVPDAQAAKATKDALSISLTSMPATAVLLPPVVDVRPQMLKPQGRGKLRPSQPNTVLNLIHYPWEKLGYDVVFMSARPGFRAMTISDRRRIEIYMRAGEGPLDVAYDLAHELGHAFDLEYNDASRRAAYCVLRGIDPQTPWFGCNRCPDYDTPAGDFAETFAFLLLGPGNFHSRMSPPPALDTIPQLADFCKIELGVWYAQMIKAGPGAEPPISKAVAAGVTLP